MFRKTINKFDDSYLIKFKPLQVEVRNGDFERASKDFKVMVQREKIISLYKEHQKYEKPSEKKRRKRRESEEKRLVMAYKALKEKNGQ